MSAVKKYERVKVTNYRDTCLLCGREFTAPTEKRLEWLMTSHKRDKHSKGVSA